MRMRHMKRTGAVALRICMNSLAAFALAAVCCIGAGAEAWAEEEAGAEAGQETASETYEEPAGESATEESAELTEDSAPVAASEDTSPAVEEETSASGEEAQDAAASEEENKDNLVDPTQRADNSFIYDTSIGAIAEQSNLYNNRTVQVEGEVIGDRIAAGNGYYWVELSSYNEDDTASISVLLSEEQTTQIDRYGKYGVTGTTLQVRGTYHQACDEHEGLSDIHATAANVVASGEDHPDEFSLRAFVPGVITLAIGVVLLLVFRFARERMR